MAIGVDTSKWKPRKIQGTPANKFRNYLGLGIIGTGFLIGVFLQCSKYTLGFRKAIEVLYEDPIEEVERKQLIAAGLGGRSSATIREEMEYFKRPDRPDC